jgi:phospholipid/cholesterol/gamma-HCH transport system substrate-binding protein
VAASPARLAGVGLFVLGTLLLFGVAVFMIGNRQMAFTDRFSLYTEFARVTGLQAGAIVRVSGARAGEVTEIVPPSEPAGKFRVQLQVTEELHELVRTDSVASIQTEGLVGGSFLAISSGTAAAPEAPPLSTIASLEPFELADLLQQMSGTIVKVNTTIDQMSGELQQTIVSVGETVKSANDLVTSVSADVRTMAETGARVSADLASLTTGVREGRGTVGKLFNDDELYASVKRIAGTADAIAADARTVVAQARETLSGMQRAQGPVAGLADNLRQTLDDARSAMSVLAENMDALRHNFLLRGFFNSRGYFDLEQISPSEYRAGALSKNGRTPVRVWLGADRLFETVVDEEAELERLTPDGRRRLDAAMAPYLDRVIDGVLMVEGFAPEGGRDQQFVASRARAVAVRGYLVTRFHLDPRATGVMPLGQESAGSPSGGPWNGIALAFFLQGK